MYLLCLFIRRRRSCGHHVLFKGFELMSQHLLFCFYIFNNKILRIFYPETDGKKYINNSLRTIILFVAVCVLYGGRFLFLNPLLFTLRVYDVIALELLPTHIQQNSKIFNLLRRSFILLTKVNIHRANRIHLINVENL